MPDDPTEDSESNPLPDLDEWEDFLREPIPAPVRKRRFATTGRPCDRPSASSIGSITASRPSISSKRREHEYLGLNHRRMGIWEAMEFLNTLVDDSDPDTS